MDAKRFFRVLAAECETRQKCAGCAFHELCTSGLEDLTDEEIDEFVDAAEAIPDGRTYEERFFDAFPDAPREEDGSPVACLGDIFPDADGVCEDPLGKLLPASCAECWRRVPG